MKNLRPVKSSFVQVTNNNHNLLLSEQQEPTTHPSKQFQHSNNLTTIADTYNLEITTLANLKLIFGWTFSRSNNIQFCQEGYACKSDDPSASEVAHSRTHVQYMRVITAIHAPRASRMPARARARDAATSARLA